MAGETYVKRYAGGFADGAGGGTPVDSTFLNAVETALLRLLGEDPAADEVGVWTPASNRFVFQKIANAQIDAAAAIDKSKLGALNIVNADIAATAAIAKSKLAALNIADADIVAGAAIAIAKLAGYPSDATKVLKGDGTWGRKIYRKSTAKTVNNTIAETDLLNGEITIAANEIGATGLVRITAHGDMLNNTGLNQPLPRFKLKLGATTLLDTNALANWSTNAARQSWVLQAVIQNLNATNSQWASFSFAAIAPSSGTTAVVFTTGQGTGFQSAAAGGYGTFNYEGGGGGAVDTTLAQALALSVINGVANANYEIVLKGAVVEVL